MTYKYNTEYNTKMIIEILIKMTKIKTLMTHDTRYHIMTQKFYDLCMTKVHKKVIK